MSINQPSGSNYNARSPHFGQVVVRTRGDIRQEIGKAITDHKIKDAAVDLYYPFHSHMPPGKNHHMMVIHTGNAAIDKQIAEMLKALKEKKDALASKIKTIYIEHSNSK